MARTDNVENTPVDAEAIQEQLRKENEYIIKNKRVRRQSRRRTIIIILLVFLLIMAVLAGVTYSLMQFVEDSNFRVSVSHTDAAVLSLSKDYNFTNPTSVLDVSAPQNMDNCTLCNYIDQKILDIYNTDGSYKGEGTKEYFIATTFYLKNTGRNEINYREIISLDRAMKDMDKAIRVMVIKDIEPPDDEQYGTITVYAAAKCDAAGNTLTDEEGNPLREEVVPPGGTMSAYIPENIIDYQKFDFNEEDIREDGVWMAKTFADESYVINNVAEPALQPGQIIKYTIVIWLEGQDAQCVDDILGGQVKLAVEFALDQ
ncbi:MAG: hypothetical protein J6U39_04395 [Clostridia bacterium]|nr:hypothetical protein [Clostridia bacterium]